MALFTVSGIRVSGLAAAIPSDVEDNADLELLSKAERGDFILKTGIASRRVATSLVCASDLCIAAAERLLQESATKKDEIGIVVFVTQTPDHLLPGNSMIAQKKLQLSSQVYALDINQGCAGYVYGLSTVSAIMQSTGLNKGLLLVGDTITKLVSPNDRTTLPIFSDAGSATLLERTSEDSKIHFNLGAQGNGFESIFIRDGGSRCPAQLSSLTVVEDAPGVGRTGLHLRMEGVDVLAHSLRYVVPNIRELMAYGSVDQQVIDHFVFHQANRILNDNLVRRLGIPVAKVPETLTTFGNTSSATIPLTTLYRLREEVTTSRRKLLMSGFGAGFSWGSCLLDLDRIICTELIELKTHDYQPA